MATEINSSKTNTKNDKDGSTNEVKDVASTVASVSANEGASPAPAKEESKSVAAKETTKPAAAKEEKKAGTSDSAKTNEAKPAATSAAAGSEAKAAVKDEGKTAANAAAVKKEEPKPAVKDEAKPVAAAAPKEESKPEVAAAPAPQKEEPKPAASAPKAAPAPETPRPAAPKPPPMVDTVSRVGRAEAIVRRNVLWALGAGVVPFPIFDAVAVTGVQLKMLSELSELYKVTFTESIAKKILGSLLSGIGGVALGTMVGSSLVKLVPGVGTALGIVSVPVIGGAATHATGKIFIMHFESGGTLLDFDPHKMRSHFKQEFEKSRQTVSDIHKAEQPKTNKGN